MSDLSNFSYLDLLNVSLNINKKEKKFELLGTTGICKRNFFCPLLTNVTMYGYI